LNFRSFPTAALSAALPLASWRTERFADRMYGLAVRRTELVLGGDCNLDGARPPPRQTPGPPQFSSSSGRATAKAARRCSALSARFSGTIIALDEALFPARLRGLISRRTDARSTR
jgi:hypothetical protein